MALTTVADMTKFAMRKLGVLKSGDVPTASEQSDALDYVNAMVRQWSAKRYLTGQLFRRTFTWPAATTSRTIGATGDFVNARPQKILGGFARDTTNLIDYPIVPIPQEKYEGITVKTIQGIPFWIFSQPTNTNWNLFLYYVPNKSYDLTLDILEPFTEYAAGTDALNLPIEYTEALAYNLALRMADDFGVTPSQTIVLFAADALKDIKEARAEPIPEVIVAKPLTTRNRWFNYISGF